MENTNAITALKQVRTYCSAEALDALGYAIEVLEKLERDGIKSPLSTDFCSKKNQN